MPNPRAVLDALGRGPLSVHELTGVFRCPEGELEARLALLIDEGLVRRRPGGYYALTPEGRMEVWRDAEEPAGGA